MEEKKVLNEEETKEVSGGRYLAERYLARKEFAGLSSADKEAILERVEKLDLKSGEIPREFLDAVSGGGLTGGELDEVDMLQLDLTIYLYQNSGRSLDDCLRILSNAGYSGEALSYIANNW